MPANSGVNFAPALASPARLGDQQREFLIAVVRSALAERSVQFRHATPFTPVRRQLRETCRQLRAVLVDHDVAAANAPAVIAVLTARARRLAEQRRHCRNARFAQTLLDEERALRSLLGALEPLARAAATDAC